MNRKEFAGDDKKAPPRRSYDDDYVERVLHEFRRVQYLLKKMPDQWATGTTPGNLRKDARFADGPFRVLGMLDNDKWDTDNRKRMLEDDIGRKEREIEEINRELSGLK